MMLPETRMAAVASYYLPALVLGAVIGLMLPYASALHFPIGNDAIGYMYDAENLLAGQGAVRPIYGVSSPEADFAPTVYHPPTFGVLIAALAVLGLDVEQAAMAISWAALILLPLAIVFALRPLLAGPWSLVVAVLSVTSPSIYLYGPSINTDVVALVFILTGAGLVFRGLNQPLRSGPLLLGGLALGVAYAFRNATLAVYVGYFAALISMAILRQWELRSVIQAGALVLIGSLPVVLPLWLRNYFVFGEYQPYHVMLGQYGTLLDSFRVFLNDMLWDLTGSRGLARSMAWDVVNLLVVGVPVAILLCYGLWRRWLASATTHRFILIFALMFVGAGASMLVIAHTYHGLDPGNLIRHMMPYAWLIYAVIIWALVGIHYRYGAMLSGFCAGLVLVGHLTFIGRDMMTHQEIEAAFTQSDNILDATTNLEYENVVLTSHIKRKITQDPVVTQAIRELPERALIFANAGPLLAYIGGRPVRALESAGIERLADMVLELDALSARVQGSRPVYVAFVPDNRLIRSPMKNRWQDYIVEHLPGRYQVAHKSNNLLIMSLDQHPGQVPIEQPSTL